MDFTDGGATVCVGFGGGTFLNAGVTVINRNLNARGRAFSAGVNYGTFTYILGAIVSHQNITATSQDCDPQQPTAGVAYGSEAFIRDGATISHDGIHATSTSTSTASVVHGISYGRNMVISNKNGGASPITIRHKNVIAISPKGASEGVYFVGVTIEGHIDAPAPSNASSASVVLSFDSIKEAYQSLASPLPHRL